jgi:NHL repeat
MVGQEARAGPNEWLAKFIQEQLFTLDYEETVAWYAETARKLSPLSGELCSDCGSAHLRPVGDETIRIGGAVGILGLDPSGRCGQSPRRIPRADSRAACFACVRAFVFLPTLSPRGAFICDGKKQTVVQFAPDGQVLKTLGKPGVAGDGPDTFNSPSDVLVAPNGDIFVADGHGDYPVPKTNDRMVKFSKDGKFLKAWGRHGSAPGEFDVPHGLAMDSAGRLFVADRANSRIQIFDQDGKFLAEWKQFGRPSGVYIRDDIIYVADSQSDEKTNPPFRQGIPIGSVKDGKVTAFISQTDPKQSMPEGVAANKDGNVFAGFTTDMDLRKFAKN